MMMEMKEGNFFNSISLTSFGIQVEEKKGERHNTPKHAYVQAYDCAILSACHVILAISCITQITRRACCLSRFDHRIELFLLV